MEKTNKRQIRFDLKKKILMLGVLPVLVLGLMVIFIAQTIVRDSLLKEIKDALQSAATSTFAAYDQNSGDYIKTENGEIWKGSYNISKSESLVDSIKEKTGLEVTFFYGKDRIMTSAKDKNGDRILGSPAGETIQKEVLEKGKEYFSDSVSIDGTLHYASKEIAKKNGARVIEVPKKGYGNAVIGGIRAAKGRYIIMGDCDKSYDFKEIGRFIRPLRSGKQLVMGSRFAGGIEPGAMSLSHRYFGVPLLSFLGRLRYRTKVQDFHCGLRGFEKEAALALGLSCGGMEFATEMIGKFAGSGAKIAQVPVSLRKDGRQGHSHLRTIPDGMRHLRYLCRNIPLM